MKSVFLDQSRIEYIAKRLFNLPYWLETYGKPMYYIRSRQFLDNKDDENALPDEWDTIYFGFRHYIFLNEDRLLNKTDLSANRRLKVSPEIVQKILDTDFSVKGTQRKLARELGFNESHISRIRRRIMRQHHTEPKKLSFEEKQELALKRREVELFFQNMWTLQDWVEQFGQEYQIKRTRILYWSWSRGRERLPDDWGHIRTGDTWLIYKKSD